MTINTSTASMGAPALGHTQQYGSSCRSPKLKGFQKGAGRVLGLVCQFGMAATALLAWVWANAHVGYFIPYIGLGVGISVGITGRLTSDRSRTAAWRCAALTAVVTFLAALDAGWMHNGITGLAQLHTAWQRTSPGAVLSAGLAHIIWLDALLLVVAALDAYRLVRCRKVH